MRGAGDDTDDGSDTTGAAEQSDTEDGNAESATRTAQDIEDVAETGGTSEYAGVAFA